MSPGSWVVGGIVRYPLTGVPVTKGVTSVTKFGVAVAVGAALV